MFTPLKRGKRLYLWSKPQKLRRFFIVRYLNFWQWGKITLNKMDKMKRKFRRRNERLKEKIFGKAKAEPISMDDLEAMESRTEEGVTKLIVERLCKFFGNDFEKKAEEVQKRTAIFRKKGAALVLIDGQPALEVFAPKWIPSAQGVDCHIDYKEYEVNANINYLKN